MNTEFQVVGVNAKARFTLKLHRGDGMTLIAMNWKEKEPPADFVGFAIEYKEPKGKLFFALKNRLAFASKNGSIGPNTLSTLLSPIQKFRWVHFPRNAELDGEFVYRVTPMFMNELEELSQGEAQEASIQLRRETYPDQLNITFTRGFVSSQAFVDRFISKIDTLKQLMPKNAEEGLTFAPTHSKKEEAYAWMGFEARSAILEVLDKAVADKKAEVRVVAYDLNEPGVLTRLEKIGKRLQVIIDNDGAHGEEGSAENQAEERLKISAGANNVMRHHMGKLQHNKTIVVDGPSVQAVVCSSTNFSWRGFFIQANNALVLTGASAVKIFTEAFKVYKKDEGVAAFGKTSSAIWNKLGLKKIDASIAFSPHNSSNALLQSIADDLNKNVESSLFYSLAFLSMIKGPIRTAVTKLTNKKGIFVYGISDKATSGFDLQMPDGKVAPVFATQLDKKSLPEPFKSEPSGGGGTRMHHKFLVLDFDKPTARVYLGSYNFSDPADTQNGENLLLIRDRRIAVSYMIEALRIFDHYHFRVIQKQAKSARKKLALQKPPRKRGEKPWWKEDYTDARKIRDRLLFA